MESSWEKLMKCSIFIFPLCTYISPLLGGTSYSFNFVGFLVYYPLRKFPLKLHLSTVRNEELRKLFTLGNNIVCYCYHRLFFCLSALPLPLPTYIHLEQGYFLIFVCAIPSVKGLKRISSPAFPIFSVILFLLPRRSRGAIIWSENLFKIHHKAWKGIHSALNQKTRKRKESRREEKTSIIIILVSSNWAKFKSAVWCGTLQPKKKSFARYVSELPRLFALVALPRCLSRLFRAEI